MPEEKVSCRCVLDSFSRRIVGWSIDTVQHADLVVNALDMAIKNRRPNQLAWFTRNTERTRPSGLSRIKLGPP
jgi:transposase InsO family protein